MTTRMPAPERRDQLLEVAALTFGREGYHGASMNDIAEAAGVTKPVLYQHWDSKHDLFLALLHTVGAEVETVVGEALDADVEPRALVENALRAYFTYFEQHRHRFGLVFGDGVLGEPAFATERRSLEHNLALRISEVIDIPGVDRTGRRLIAHGIVGLCEGVVRYCVDAEQPPDVDGLVDQVGELMWAGLRGERPR
ncbi:MAG: TetR/AcrR family transcriptional regulator [Acidimicrobiia bacterium]|nr:TetR/AcrR family transcriptional regulator [Acidimicrobiia bacterium]